MKCNQMKVNIGVIQEQPYVTPCFDGMDSLNCNRPGLAVELTRIICSNLNLSCIFTIVDHYNYGTVINGTPDGLVADIANGTFDTSLPVFTPTITRITAIDFSDFVMENTFKWMMRQPKQSSPSLIAFLLGSWRIWLLLITAMVLMGVVLSLVDWHQQGHLSLAGVMGRGGAWAFHLFSACLGQTEKEAKGRRSSSLLLLGLWCLVMVLLLTEVSSHVTSMMMQHSFESPISSIERLADCITRRQCRLLTKTKMNLFYLEILSARKGSKYYPLRVALESNPALVKDWTAEDILADDGNLNVVFASDGTVDLLAQRYPACTFSTALVFKGKTSYPVRKKSCFKRVLNDLLLRVHSSGMFQKVRHKYLSGSIAKTECRAASVEGEPLTLPTVNAAFLLLLVGLFSSILFFFGEMSCKLIYLMGLRFKFFLELN
jgi:Ligand-gated ion channel/Ligated ion channel L-glutamate- and glycine-binding site